MPCYNVLQGLAVAVWCSVLQLWGSAVFPGVSRRSVAQLQRTATHCNCNTLQHTVQCGDRTLQHTVQCGVSMCCPVLQCVAVCCRVLLCVEHTTNLKSSSHD